MVIFHTYYYAASEWLHHPWPGGVRQPIEACLGERRGPRERGGPGRPLRRAGAELDGAALALDVEVILAPSCIFH
jgi:hypothetical protein